VPALKLLSVLQDHDGVVGLAEFAGTFDDRLQHRTDISRRRGDDVEDVGAAGLVGESFRQLARLGLYLVEQANILDGNYSLVGKSGDQGYLLFGKKLDALAREYNDAD